MEKSTLAIIVAIVVILAIIGVAFFAMQQAPPTQATTTTVTTTVTQTVTVGAAPQTIKITVWASGSPVDVTRVDNVEKAAEILNKMLEAAGTGIRIEVEKQYFRGDYMDKLTAAFAAGEAPDIIAMKNLAALAEGGYVIPLDDHVQKYSMLLEDVVPVLWNSVKYKGKIWALPQDTEARPLYFRKDVLRQLGWSEEEINALPEKIRNGEVTLQDLIKVAKEAMEKGLVEWGFYHRPNFGGTPFIILYYPVSYTHLTLPTKA